MANNNEKFDINMELFQEEEEIGFKGNFRGDKAKVSGKIGTVVNVIKIIKGALGGGSEDKKEKETKTK